MDKYWVLKYNPDYAYILLDQVSGLEMSLALQFILIDARPNTHSFHDYGKLYKINLFTEKGLEYFINPPTYSLDKSNAKLLTFDPEIYFA